MKNLYNLHQLDKKLLPYQNLSPRPNEGWVKTIRVTLGMTYQQFASKVGLSTRRVIAIETAEVEKKLKLETLEKVADILGCELRYALVPKRGSSLVQQVESKAMKKARAILMRSGQQMSLEDQLASDELKLQMDVLKQELLHQNLKGLWDEA